MTLGSVVAQAMTICRSSPGTVVPCVSCCICFFAKTRLGVAMQASSQNQLAAYCMGIPVRNVFSI